MLSRTQQPFLLSQPPRLTNHCVRTHWQYRGRGWRHGQTGRWEEVALLLEDTVLTEQDAAQVEEDIDMHVDMDDLLRICLQQWYVTIFNSANK